MLWFRSHILGRPQYAVLRVLPLLLLLTGCGAFSWSQTSENLKETTKTALSMPGLNYFGVIAFACIAFGVVAIIASFVPVASVFVPRKAAVAAIGCGVGVHLIHAFLAKFGAVLIYGSFALLVIGGACALWPYFVAAVRGTLFRKSKELMKGGHVREAAAFEIAATPNAAKSGQVRKAILAKLEAKVHPAP